MQEVSHLPYYLSGQSSKILKNYVKVIKNAFRYKFAHSVSDSIPQSQHQTAVSFLLKAVCPDMLKLQIVSMEHWSQPL